jgi:hypothetical protein
MFEITFYLSFDNPLIEGQMCETSLIKIVQYKEIVSGHCPPKLLAIGEQ